MEQVVATFDQVLHLHRHRGGRFQPKHTVFSFMSCAGYTPYVTVPGWPSVEPGTTVTALLRQPGNWQSLVGWVNQATGEIAAPNCQRSFWGAVIDAIWGIAWFLLWPAHFGPLRWAPPVLGIVLCLFGLLQARREQREALAVQERAGAMVANHSVEPTNCGKPQSAAHLER